MDRKEYFKEYSKKNREKIAERQKKRFKERYQNDPVFREKMLEKNRAYSSAGYRRAWHLKTTYGMSPADYQAMLAKQEGTCAICKGPPRGRHKRYHVDHDHKTGEVRGLLCGPCNQGIGLFGEDRARLLTAAEYLARA